MMSKRRTTSAPKTPTRVTTTTLTPLEEKVVRMRHGLRAPNTLMLGTAAEGHPEAEAALAEMEQRFLAEVGPRTNSAKRKIVSALRDATPPRKR
jgi:hypothetical protein